MLARTSASELGLQPGICGLEVHGTLISPGKFRVTIQKDFFVCVPYLTSLLIYQTVLKRFITFCFVLFYKNHLYLI